MNKKQQEFIVMRSQGVSFDEISKQLNTSKPSLIKWSKKFQIEIDDLKFEMMVQLKEQFQYSYQKKYEQLLKQLEKIDKAILEIDLSDTSLKDLILAQKNIQESITNLERSVFLRKTDVSEFILQIDDQFEKELPLYLSEV
jgi:transcriptional regulator